MERVCFKHSLRKEFSTGVLGTRPPGMLQGGGRRREPGRGQLRAGGAAGGPGKPRRCGGGGCGDWVSLAGRQEYLCDLGSPT